VLEKRRGGVGLGIRCKTCIGTCICIGMGMNMSMSIALVQASDGLCNIRGQ